MENEIVKRFLDNLGILLIVRWISDGKEENGAADTREQTILE